MAEAADRIKSGLRWPVRSGGWTSRGTGADTWPGEATATLRSYFPNLALWWEPAYADS